MLSPIRRWKQSLHLRMSVALSLLIILAMTTVAAIQLLHLRTALTAAAENRAQAIGRTFVMIGSAAVTENLFRIQEALLRYDDEKDIAELDFVDDDHMIVAALHPKRIGKIVTDATFANAQAQARETLTQSETAGGDPRLVVWEPLYEGPAINGWVRIEFSLTPLQEETIRWGKTLAVFTVLLIIVGMAIIQLALRRISGFFTDTIGQLQKTLVALRSSAVVKASVHDGGIGLPSAHTSTQHGTLEQLASVIATTAELLNAQATSLNTFTTSLEELVRERTNQLIQANVTLQRDEQTLRSHQDALLQLTKNIHTEQLEEALRQITETAAQTLDVQRTSIWFYTEERTGIECKDLHEVSHRRHSSGMTLKAADFPRYFNELLHQQIIAVTDARSDPRTCEFTASYLNPLGITSMLNTPVTHNGQMYGVICLEHTGEPRTWTVEEQQFSASLANLVALALETAERTQAEQALRSSEQRTRSIIETALDAVISITHDGIVTEWNRRAEIVFGWRSEEAVGRQIADTIIPPQHRDAHRMRLQRYLETGEGSVLDQRIEITALRRDGSEFPIELAIAPIRFADSCSFTAFISDISTRKQAQEALRQAKESAESASLAKSQFLANMSHEIRTPMNGVIGMTELLFGTTLTDRQRHLAETVHRSATALLDVINDILDFSKIEAGKLQLEQMDFDLPRLFEEVTELFAEPVHRKGLELLCRTDEAVPVRLNGDPVRLRQILINLLSNAVKFTERGEVVLSVDLVETRRDETLLRFNVKDSGVGVPPDAQQRIFRAFDQADSSTTRKYGGTGLGLAIVNRLVELMGGMIGIESVPGEGSTFWFVIPLGISTQPPMKVEQFLQARRLLVVDDNNTNRMILSHHLQQWGAASTGAESGAQALALLHRAAEDGLPFDAAILDMQMPGMDGLELARTIAAHPRLSSIRLVMLTSLGDQGGAAQAAGVHLTLTKPVAQIRLREALTTLFVSGTVAPAPQTPSPRPLSLSGHVLLAEDNAVNREVALGMLEMLGCCVYAVEHGRLAVEAVAAQRFDLILMDCQMPEMDGFTATALIREQEASATPSRHIPIVALTANAMEGDRARCLAAGMDDYLTKPFTLQSLQDMLSRWLPVKSTGLPPVSQPATPRKTEPPEMTSLPEPLPELLDTQAWKAILALQRPGQPDLLAKILGLYLKDSHELVDKIQAAVTDRNARLLQEAAHSLKSRSATLGAHQLAELCKQLELAGRTQSFEQTEQRVDQLTKVFAETCALFCQELKGRAA